jgi:uncharacterized protein YggE
MKPWVFGTALAMIAMPAAAQDVRMQPVDGTLLEISAAGHSDRVPDLATINAGVVTEAPTAAAAMSANAGKMRTVLAALRGAGVAERDIRTTTIALSPQYRHLQGKTPVITGYQASNQVTVRFRDIAKAGTILDSLVTAGANSIDGPNLSVENPETALDEARTSAIGVARARAELYARAAGLRVDRILAISEASAWSPPSPMNFRMVANEAMAQADTAIVAGEQRLTVNVQVKFVLK